MLIKIIISLKVLKIKLNPQFNMKWAVFNSVIPLKPFIYLFWNHPFETFSKYVLKHMA